MDTVTQLDHRQMVADLAKPGKDIRKTLNPQKWGLLMPAILEVLKAGQHLDLVKKAVVYDKPGCMYFNADQKIPALSNQQVSMLHMAIGIAGEASELLEAVMRFIMTGELDRENFIEELGDLEFYMEGIRKDAIVTRRETLNHNLDKLVRGPKARYSGKKYSDQAAQDRADKA